MLVPQLISVMYGAISCYARAFYIIVRIMLLSSVIPFIVRPLKREAGAPAEAEAQA